MPDHLVGTYLACGDLVALDIEADPTPPDGLTIYAAHRQDHALGPAARWLLDDLRRRSQTANPFGPAMPIKDRGKKPSYSRDQLQNVIGLISVGTGASAIAKATGLTRQTVLTIRDDQVGAETELAKWDL